MNEFIHNLFKSFDSFHQFLKSGSHSNACVSCTKFSIAILFASIRFWSQKDFFYATKVFLNIFQILNFHFFTAAKMFNDIQIEEKFEERYGGKHI